MFVGLDVGSLGPAQPGVLDGLLGFSLADARLDGRDLDHFRALGVADGDGGARLDRTGGIDVGDGAGRRVVDDLDAGDLQPLADQLVADIVVRPPQVGIRDQVDRGRGGFGGCRGAGRGGGGLGREADDADGVALLGFAMLDVALLVAGPCEGKRLPAWLRTTPTRANTTSRISAISGQVQGLRPRRFGSSSGSS